MANGKEEAGLDRREFLKTAALAGIGLAGFLAGSVGGCATPISTIKQFDIVKYPRLNDGKVQFPVDGCLIGFSNAEGGDNSEGHKGDVGSELT